VQFSFEFFRFDAVTFVTMLDQRRPDSALEELHPGRIRGRRRRGDQHVEERRREQLERMEAD
jgi:hypothetical protein